MKWFEDLSLRNKLVLGFGLVTLLLIATGLLAIRSLGQLNAADTELYRSHTVRLGQVGEWSTMLERYQTRLRDLALADSPARRDGITRELAALSARATELQEAYEAQIHTEADREHFQALVDARQAFLAPAREAVALVEDGRSEDALALFNGEAATRGAAYSAALDAIATARLQSAEEAAAANTALYTGTRTLLLLVLGVGVLLAAAIAVFIARWITTRLEAVVERVQQLRERDITSLGAGASAIVAGDLDHRIDYGTEPLGLDVRDEIGALARAVDAIIETTGGTARHFEAAQRVIGSVVRETRELVHSAGQGDLSRRAEGGGLEGAYAELVMGLNGLMAAVAAPIDEAATVLQALAERDLSVRMQGAYRGDYERVKTSLNAAIGNLEEALTEVSAASEQVSGASDEIASGSQTMAEGASEQASSLEEVSSSLQELASMANQNAGNAREARSLAEGAAASTEKGSEAMTRLSATVHQIKESSDATARIVRTIDEIAFQTNLLALNAAVEAARAGEAGKGFAVVAEEVRNLAMRSADAAKETAGLIQESVERSESGVTVQAEVVAQLGEIRTGVTRVLEVMAEIAAASEQQTDGVGQINTAVEEVNAVTQRSAASAEESASAAEELSGQAERMADLVGRFTLTATGRRVGAGVVPDRAGSWSATGAGDGGGQGPARGVAAPREAVLQRF